MTRKDYELIAAAIKEAKPLLPPVADYAETTRQLGWQTTAHAVAEALARDNPRFDRERFLAACGF